MTGSAIPRVPSRHWTSRGAGLAVILVVIAAVGGVTALRTRAANGREAELLLVRLDGLTQQQYAQLGRAAAEGSADESLLLDVRASRAAFDESLKALRSGERPPEELGLETQVVEFRRSADAALRMLAGGQPSLAAVRLQNETGPAVQLLLGRLAAAEAASGERADRLDRVGDIGSISLLLLAAGVVWLLLRLTGRARREADRSHAEVASQERFRALVQHSSDVITVTDRVGKIIYQSPSVSPVFGYAVDELVGKELQRFVHPDDVRAVIRSLIETARSSGSDRIECRIRHRDGTWRSVESAVTAGLDDPSINGLVLNTRDVTERKQLEEQLAHQAFHDSLTGLANRALFRDRVEHAMARMRRAKRPIAVLLLDLDGFKTVNDSLGHAFGDAFLVAVAERLRTLLRPSDTPCRLGGDEFAVLVDDLLGPIDATVVAERIVEGLRQPFMIEGKEVLTTASIGLTIAESTSSDADDLLRNADVAMYRAKDRGRNRFEIFQPSMHKAMLERLDLEADLRRAVDLGEFVLHYQPTVSLSTGSIAGMEALVRWQSPTRGLVPPGLFIPLAEETGLIVPLGRWVLEESCRQAVAWRQEFGTDAPATMSINLSARQLHDETLVSQVADVLVQSGIEPDRVVLEITESAVMADAALMTARLHELKALGVRLAIDDFGTGYSSMSYLCSFPIDILKIDRSFVHGVNDEPQKMGIVRAIIELGHILDLQTVAEGIELDVELQELRSLECDLGQGFWFARPLTVDRVRIMLSEQAASRRRGDFSVVPVPLAVG